ncbi:hypothetical protein [Flavobacterium sp. TAB 87]|uniref:hypothetical protein n=1 Tax=Flavobacterium sp. TAB 87 TaxID=1729581 RepID=UPI00076CB042|nr:hypothetical protein [Flavobacterium sp. TAB 87]KVV16023.1 hypothetical protein AP058_00458 [Flavobacterium sp. TAB 87]
MSKIYKILWIDDEHDDDALLPFILQAEAQGIILEGYGSFKEGFYALESNINNYDLILLDALFFEDETSETPNPAGLGSAIQKIHELRSRKTFPYFVLSGQTHFTDVTNPILEAFKIRCYNKKNPDDVKELLINIKTEADNQIVTQIKHENQLLFNVLKEYPDEVRDTFITIFRNQKEGNNQFDDQLYFTQLRIILEHLFRKANDIGILHDACVQKGNNQVNLTESSLFLAGFDTKHLNVNCAITHFPKLIAENVKNIIYTTGAASHTSNVNVTQNIDIQAYRKDIISPYLLYSLAFQLMDVLLWFDSYSKTNDDIALNRSLWKSFNRDQFGNKIEIEKITNITHSGWGTVEINNGTKKISIHKDAITQSNLAVGDQIKFNVKDSSLAQNITKI